MKKVVVKLASVEDPQIKQKPLKTVAGMPGVTSVSVKTKEAQIIIIGEADPVAITLKLKKYGNPELMSVGPAKEDKKEEKTESTFSYPGHVVVYPPYPAYTYPASPPADSTCRLC